MKQKPEIKSNVKVLVLLSVVHTAKATETGTKKLKICKIVSGLAC